MKFADYFLNARREQEAQEDNQIEISNAIEVTTLAPSRPQCSDEEFRCPYLPYTLCVHYEKICDGHNDCGDGSDELNCNSAAIDERRTGCRAGEYRCHDGQCIAGVKRCNREYDCTDGTDETLCGECSDNMTRMLTEPLQNILRLRSRKTSYLQSHLRKQNGKGRSMSCEIGMSKREGDDWKNRSESVNGRYASALKSLLRNLGLLSLPRTVGHLGSRKETPGRSRFGRSHRHQLPPARDPVPQIARMRRSTSSLRWASGLPRWHR